MIITLYFIQKAMKIKAFKQRSAEIKAIALEV